MSHQSRKIGCVNYARFPKSGNRIAMCISYSADSCLLSHKEIVLLMLLLTYEDLAGTKHLILLLYIWLDAAVKLLKYVNTLWLRL